MGKSIEVLLCYRGQFNDYVTALAAELRKLGLRVSYDSEILADSRSFDEEAEVDWLTLGFDQQENTRWRAPLRAAVESAEMVAFALNFTNPSENVTNEIRWAIQCKAHTFFLMHGGMADPRYQGLIVGKLAAEYMVNTGQPEYPEFGVHFCGDLTASFREDVVVAANRISAHLARCQEEKLPTLPGDNDAKVSDVEQRPYMKGRRHLHQLQEIVYSGYTTEQVPAEKPALETAMEYLHGKEMQIARAGRADRQLDRFRRAEEILLRSRPGPYELPCIGRLALEAASVEAMIHDDIRKGRPAPDFRPAVLIGTILFSNLGDGWTVISRDGYRLIVIDSMFIDFLYQLIKVSVSSAKATLHDQGGRRMVELDFGAATEQLRSKPELADGFYRCVRRHLVEGHPDSSTLGPPRQETRAALDTYVGMAERYLVGLCYALIGATGGAWPFPDLNLDFDPKDATPEQRRTLLDVTALDYAVRSRSLIDRCDPLDAVAGGLFALSAIYIRQRMLATLNQNSMKWIRETPASFRDRLQLLLQYTRGQMTKAGASETIATQSLERAWSTGTTPLQLWDHVEPRLRAEQGLRPLPAWGIAADGHV